MSQIKLYEPLIPFTINRFIVSGVTYIFIYLNYRKFNLQCYKSTSNTFQYKHFKVVTHTHIYVHAHLNN